MYLLCLVSHKRKKEMCSTYQRILEMRTFDYSDIFEKDVEIF